MKVRILAEAQAEIEAALQYLNAQTQGLGSRFLNELAAALAAIEARPLSFATVETLPGSPHRRALLATFRYSVVFEVLDHEILVVAVAHASRAANYWRDRRVE